jgi:hypothetical protein
MIIGPAPAGFWNHLLVLVLGLLLLFFLFSACVGFIVAFRRKPKDDLGYFAGFLMTIGLIVFAIVNGVVLSYDRKYGAFPFGPSDPLSWLALASPPYKCADIWGPQPEHFRELGKGSLDPNYPKTRVVGVIRFLPPGWTTCEHHGICESYERAQETRRGRAQELDLSIWDDHDRAVCEADGRDITPPAR